MADCCNSNDSNGSCCGGSGKTRLLYACSGAANTGYLADMTTRMLMTDGVGKMTCLAALGANLSGFVASAKGADENIVIDGCPVACGSAIFDNLKLPCRQIVLTDFGVKKGKTDITPELIADIKEQVKEKICNG